jgi:pimeloyl-ACP methyl ester carboxylesterase
VKHVVYLHGFPSSPASSKAQRFKAECARRGVSFSCPDLNPPASEAPTVRRMLEQARAAIGASGGPVMLVGSSLGGFIAVHAAAQDKTGRIERLALLAPAVDFAACGSSTMEDAAQYDAFNLQLRLPIDIFQGRQDDTVLPETVAAWAEGRPNVDLHWYDDGHQLAGSVDDILAVSISRFAS